ncbi:hypothetical protein C7B62_24410 [Pleurocapsa sp. CCALA 161]|uniref:hypothetical protein n=1 Tax=Pleurocapsa sp. CCALA 161 TaxID=2107688 RepID=UPI000D078442|nr:hypothetical protein [Pleurocapsa sp. CCALA 161]PSB05791.1 hypothetical protein C7B62_24410 [Pleurocapsa sp. CCALA 161]
MRLPCNGYEGEAWERYIGLIIPADAEIEVIDTNAEFELKWEVYNKASDQYKLIDIDKLSIESFKESKEFYEELELKINKLAIFLVDTIFKVNNEVFTVDVENYEDAENLNAKPWTPIEWVEGYLVFDLSLSKCEKFSEEQKALDYIKRNKTKD